jgi:hypothetical protein
MSRRIFQTTWKNISSLKGSIDRLNDLAWAGHPDMGWFEIECA